MDNASPSEQRILIVDDDKSVLQILSKILRRAGCCVTSVESGREALAELHSRTYDAAVIDVILQDMNGLDLLGRIGGISPGMKKIVLTGHPSEEDRIEALERGADYYLAKPVRSETLVEVVKGKPGLHQPWEKWL